MASAIPASLRAEVEQLTSCVIVAEVPRGGGGASRQGAEVTLCTTDGNLQHCYLSWDRRAGDPSRLPSFERETAVLEAISGPLRQSGVRIAPLIASFRSHLALLSEFVPGDDRFSRARDKLALARDYVAQIAAVHAIDVSHPALSIMGSANETPAQRTGANLRQWRSDNLAAGAEPVFQLALEWLIKNIPVVPGQSVLLHGDAGPGNFLFENDRVAALLDWELAHLGDPMEDLAEIWVRGLIQPFVPMSEVFATYRAAGGARLDIPRILFYRLYFQLSFLVPGAVASAAAGPGSVSTGTSLIYGTMHRRVIVRALAELAGLRLTDPMLPTADPDAADACFATALDDLKNDIVPAISNQRAEAKAKELARLIKFWRMRARCGRAYDTQEVAEIGAQLPGIPQHIEGARTALGTAIAEGRIEFGTALQLCHNRMVRETAILADAMGRLASTWYEDD